MHKIKEDIYWAGYVDWDLRVFHGYSTPSGSSYNAYLILDEKPTLIDTVKYYGFEEMLRRIREVIDPARIKYIISNHTEMDHSGSIERLLENCPSAEVVCSPQGAEGLKRHFFPGNQPDGKNWNFKVVRTGDVLNIGKRQLKFFLMPMVHWPDSMATYSEQDKILFPNDAFGQHYASFERFADEVGLDIVYREAAKYYGNIVMPFGAQVLKVLEAILPLEKEMICPSHGLIWRRKEDLEGIIHLYRKWAQHETEKRVIIVYDTMWHSTEKMAMALSRFLEQENLPVKIMNLQNTHISDVVAEIVSSRAVLFGSPMLNNRILPTMASLLMYLKGLKPQKRLALTFGSYGWATVGFKEFEDSIREAGFEIMTEGRYIKFVPQEKDLQDLAQWAGAIASALR